MRTAFIILILIIESFMTCPNYDLNNMTIEELTDLNHKIFSELFETSKTKYFIRSRVNKLTPDSVKNIYPEEVYLTTMKIMNSYGVDTNRFNRETIKIAVINDSLYFSGTNVEFDSTQNTCYLNLDISKIRTHRNLALVKNSEYEKHLKSITPIYSKAGGYYFHFYSLSRLDFDKSTIGASFEIGHVGAPLAGSGDKISIYKIFGKWYIMDKRMIWIS